MFAKVYKRRFFIRPSPGPVCRLCRSAADGDILCHACASDLPQTGAACHRCAIPLPDHGLCCPKCQRRPPPQDLSIARYRYDFPLSELIQQMKYSGQPSLCQALGAHLLPALEYRDHPLPDALLPMPLHWRRAVVRGYNQALELARPLAAALNRPLLTKLCRRTRATRPQTGLVGRARRDNVHNAFTLLDTPPAHVAIIDDVMTSGHTVAALSRCLRDGGAKQVEVWVLARAGTPARPPTGS